MPTRPDAAGSSEHDPIGNDARRARRERALGADAVCVVCDEVDPLKLLLAPVSPQTLRGADLARLPRCRKSAFELDHLIGRALDRQLTLRLCVACHLEITELRRVAGAKMGPPPTVLDGLGSALRSVGVVLPMLGRSCAHWGDGVLQLRQHLDQTFPAWRRKPWARWPWTR